MGIQLRSAAAATSVAPAAVGARTRAYDVARNVYNFKPANTRKLRASLGAAQAGAALAHWYCVGDSATENQVGGSGVYDHLNMWPVHLKAGLVAAGVRDGGTSVHLGSVSLTANDPRIARTSGTWTNNTYSLSSATASATLTVTAGSGTAVDVAYSNLSGAFTVTTADVNGGAPVTVTPTGANSTGHYTVTGLPEAARTITITRTAGTLIVFGASVFRASGLMVHNLGANGSTAAQWAAGGVGIAEGRGYARPAGATPSVVLVQLGANDIATRTRAQIKTDLQAVRAKYAAADVVLLGYPQPAGDSTGLWDALTNAGYDAADALDCPYVDLLERHGYYATAAANGVYGSDNIHGSTRYQADLGRSLAQLVLG